MRLVSKRFFSVTMSLILLLSMVLPTSAFAMVENPQVNSEQSIFDLINVSPEERRELVTNQIDNDKLKPSEDTLVVKYSTPLTMEQHQRAGTKVVKRIPALGYDVVQLQGNKKMEDVIRAYRNIGDVQSVTPSVPYQRLTVADPKIADMYHLEQLNISKALELAGDNEVIVAVIDTGLDMKHPELKNQVIDDYNAVNPLKRGLTDDHGTHVAGIIAAEKGNGVGGMGINPNAKILSIDVFGREWGASDFSIAEGIMYAIENKAKVINMSLGSSYPSPIIEEAVEKAIEAGVVVVAAAGNSGSNTKFYPAGINGVISVGATNEAKELAYFSTYGPIIDIVAPGEDVYAPIFNVDKHSSFMKASGTSMASPVVAGVVSLLLSKHPNLTPYEVKYILEKTAKDLGDPGYDIKYGFGLVDPVAVLQYDITQIPAKQKSIAQEDLIAKATQVTFNSENQAIISNEIAIPNQENWVRLNVNHGEAVQIVLDGPEKFDQKLQLEFFSASFNKSITVNDVAEGKVEGYLFEANENGTLVVGVMDTNEKYSETGEAAYTLAITKHSGLEEDGNNSLNPVKVNQFPYQSMKDKNGPFYLAGKDGDRDYYRFSVKEEKVVEVKVKGIPGINSSLKVYMAQEFDLYAKELMKKPKQTEDPWERNYFGPYPMYQQDRYGVGEGETLTFEAMPGMEYVVEVSSISDYYYYYYDPYYYYFEEQDPSSKVLSANLPYELEINAKVLPPDEDGYPLFGLSPIMYEETMKFEEYHQMLQEKQDIYYDYYMGGYYYGENYVEELVNAAIPLEGKVQGYFQYSGDVDIFKVEPTKTGLYEFTFNKSTTLRPSIEVMKYEEDDEGKGRLTTISYKGSYYWMEPEDTEKDEDKLYVGLEKGEKYIIWFSNDYSASLDQYTLASKLLVENPQDAYYGNNAFDKAIALPDYTFTGNFAMSEMMDVFYFEPEKEGLYGLLVENGEAPNRLKEVLPEELFSTLWTYVAIVEDKNGNKKLDPEEERGAITFYDYYNPSIRAAFNAKKDTGYFIIILNDSYYYNGTVNLTPYRMTVAPVKKSVSLPLSQIETNVWQTKGFLPFREENKEENRYVFQAPTTGTYQITMDTFNDIDGVLSIYSSNGTLISSVDHYGAGDTEFLTIALDQGSYYIGVKDYFGHASVSPYTITVKKQ